MPPNKPVGVQRKIGPIKKLVSPSQGKVMSKPATVRTEHQAVVKMGNRAQLLIRNQQISYNSQSPINSLSTHKRFTTAQKASFPREFASAPFAQNGFQTQTKEGSGKERERAVHVRRNSSIKSKAKKVVNDNLYNLKQQAGGHPLKLRLKNRVTGTENPSVKSASESKSDNESATNNIKSFTQNASIKQAVNEWKSKARPRLDSGLVGAQHSGTTGSHNDVHRITRFKELFNILDIQSFDDAEHTFEFGEKAYRLDLSEMLKDLTVVRIKKQQPAKAPNSQRFTSQREVTQMEIDPRDQVELEHQHQQLGLLKVANQCRESASSTEKLQRHLGVAQPYHTSSQTLDHPGRTKTPTNQSTGLYSAAGTPRMPVIGVGGYGTVSKSPNHLQNTSSQSNIMSPHLHLPPSKAGYTTNYQAIQKQQKNLSKRLELSTNNLNTDSALAKSSRLSNRSGISALSGGLKELKSSIVSSHEQNAMRHRSRSKQGSRNNSNSRNGNTTYRENTMVSQMSVGGLQIKRQTQTSTIIHQPGFTNESMHQLGKLKFKVHGSQEQLSIQQQQHLQSQAIHQQQIAFASGQHGSGTMSSLNPSQYLSNHDAQGLLQPEIMLGKEKFPSSDSKTGPDRAYNNLPHIDAEHESSNQYLMSHDQEEPGEEVHTQHSPIPQVHLAFLFASPLMLKTSDQKFYDVLPPISFSEEFEQIKESIEEKNIEFNYRYSVANQKNILTALRENPVGLHFSGHGFQNNEKLFQGDKKGWMKYKNKGDVLIFENESGASDFFFTTELKKMFEDIQSTKKGAQISNADVDKTETVKTTDLQFVYVASCHSEQVGRIFLEAGVPHVICIDQNETILDKAAIEFSKFFYDEVFDTFKNICDAYTYAKEKVEKAYGKFQADKIMLLKNDETHGKVCSEQKDERLNLQKGVRDGLQRIGIECDNILPNRVSPFVSRNQDMFDVLRLLSQDNNIVQIYGMPGLGKSSLLKNVTCFLGDRDIYKDGVFYIDFLHVQTFKESLQILNAYLKEEDYFYQSFNDNQDEFQQEIEKVKGKLIRFTKKFLFALDNIDHLVKENHEQFLTFIMEIASPHVKVLFTSNKFSVKEFGEGFSVKKIQKLKTQDSVELFLKKIPLGDQDKKNFLEYANIVELHEVTVKEYKKKYGICDGKEIDKEKEQEITSKLPMLCKQRHAHSSLCIVNYLSKHPIFQFFAGIPLVISIVAPLSVFKSLSEIFLYLAEKNEGYDVEGNFQDDLKHKMADESLIHCLEYCTGYFQDKKGSNLLELWYLIGTQGPGILYEDLQEILSESDVKSQLEVDKQLLDEPKEEEQRESQLDKNLQDLIQFSLIEQENLDKAGTMRRYRVSPFVDQYINTKMSNEMKRDQLNLVCMHLKTKLIELKKDFAKDIVECKTQEELGKVEATLHDKIRPYEQQIMHIVCAVIKLTKDEDHDSIGDEEDDFEGTDSKSQVNASSYAQQPVQDQSMMSLSTIKSTGTSRREKSKHNRNPSRDAPQVSDVVKYQRSTINWGKSKHAGQNPAQMIEEFKQPQHPRDRLETVADGKKAGQGKQHSSRSPNMNQTLTLNNQRRQYTKATHEGPGAEVDDSMFERIAEIQMSKAQTEHAPGGREDNSSFYARPQGPILGFVHAKQNFLADRDKAMGLSEKQGSSNSSRDAKAKQQEDQHQDDPVTPGLASLWADRDAEYSKDPKTALAPTNQIASEELKVPDDMTSRTDLKLASQKSSGPFEKSVSAFEIAKIFNKQIGEAGEHCNIDHLEYDEEKRKSDEQLEAPDFKARKQRQSLLLKGLTQHRYDESSTMLGRIRSSLLEKSISQDKHGCLHQLSSFRHNPDIVGAFMAACGHPEPVESHRTEPQAEKMKLQSALAPVLEASNSAPPKAVGGVGVGGGQGEQIWLAAHEELLFHYLAILALLPLRRNHILHVLDYYGQRETNEQQPDRDNQSVKTGTQLDLVAASVRSVQKSLRLKRAETMVAIPQNSELLQANTKMIELYVLIVQEGVFSITGVNPQHNKHIKYDRIYEEADSARVLFESIQFERGLAIIDYIQANRQLEKFKKKEEFKALLKKSAQGFAKSHELDGIQQCICQANRLREKKYSEYENQKEIESFISDIETIFTNLENDEDENVQNFNKFRKNIKIRNLHQKLEVGHECMLCSDEVYNMMLNPQMMITTQLNESISDQ